MDLKDKVVVITGAGSGLGKCLAEIFSKRGSRVIVSGRNIKEVDTVAAAIGGTAMMCDVTDEIAMNNQIAEVVNQFGQLDIYVNNAGIWYRQTSILELETIKVRQMMDVNFFGTMFGSKAALAQMKKQKNGAIVNIISTSALAGRVGSAGYCASKFAVSGFTKTLALEAEPMGVSIYGIYPGGMRTNLFNDGRPATYDQFMDPAEVAEKIVAHLEKNKAETELIIRR